MEGEAKSHIWITREEEAEWINSNRKTPLFVFSSMMSFNIVAVLALLIVKRRNLGSARAAAQLQHGLPTLLHAIASVATGIYFLSHPPSCINAIFCFNDQMNRAMDVHSGFLLFEMMFYFNNVGLIQPTFSLLSVRNTILLLGSIFSKMLPCSLSLQLLPWHQILAAFSGIDAMKELALAFNAPRYLKVGIIFLLPLAALAQIGGGASLALQARTFIQDNALATLELPYQRTALLKPYIWVILGGSWLLTGFYINWFSEAVKLSMGVLRGLNRAAAIEALQNQVAAKAGTESTANKKKGKKK